MAKTIELLDNRYSVFILPEARSKMEMYCDLSNGEIGWLAYVEKFDNVGYLITDCALLKQEVHSATTEIDPMALIEFWNNITPEQQEKVKCWGHSHVNMSVSPSGQDNDQMEYFKDGNPWFIRLITNKKREYHIDIYDYEHGIKVHMDQSDLKTFNPREDELRKNIEEEIKEKVSEKKYTPAKTNTSSSVKYFHEASKYDYRENDKRYSNGYYNSKKNEKKENDLPVLKGMEVKYVSSFDEILNDADYWQDLG